MNHIFSSLVLIWRLAHIFDIFVLAHGLRADLADFTHDILNDFLAEI